MADWRVRSAATWNHAKEINYDTSWRQRIDCSFFFKTVGILDENSTQFTVVSESLLPLLLGPESKCVDLICLPSWIKCEQGRAWSFECRSRRSKPKSV